MLTVVYTGSRDPLSKLARVLTQNAKWSHCGILVEGFVVEARVWYGVVATPFEEWKARCPHYEVVQIDCPNPAAARSFAWSQIGVGYDYLGAFGVPFRSSWQDSNRWYCSELVEAALAAGGRQRWRDSKSGISPQESWDVL